MAARLHDTIARSYDKRVMLSPGQIEVIAGAILARQPGCNLLVFGLGHDSALWADLNAAGRTLFLEDSDEWIRDVLFRHPQLNALHVSYAGQTVESSLKAPDEVIARAVVPDFLRRAAWDVILIDGPTGYLPTAPGRALPIIWSAEIRAPGTHVFVHDYDRPLEQQFTDRLLRTTGTVATIPGARGMLFWSIGRSAAFGAGAA